MSAEFILLSVVAYLLGSVSFAVLLSRLRHLPDPRSVGSGNPGASNMLRLGNRSLALATLAGDLTKGATAVWLARYLNFEPVQQAWVGLAVITGHILPIYYHFRGGKGVATAAGVLLVISWPAALLASSLWIITFAVQRMASLASLVACMALLPWIAWQETDLLLPIVFMVILIMLRHRLNIERLLAGTESRFGG
ncbi:MAG TPA: glycerol-3-phosphate 1-O-acyltransferase [Pseudomonas xinjiangensis]|uniref:Glycerol-3-phosphate acyltransferase n=2 Tax=root TaxID=1 RepID=A0A7V1BKW4_9GAMM|nr:glycerol-3-phosphate 1-O-acyltransferase [Halopseudomonas xinjiangensis]HEC46037.1 glycerol-3-phosphate 1-O-acyltransferase [Halopseudomonas xinjiangensis]